MKCNFLSGKYLFACTADRKVYMPSTFELQEYCRAKAYSVCPLYPKVKIGGKEMCRGPEIPLRAKA